MLLFILAMAVELVFSKFTCFLLKNIGNLIENMHLLETIFHQNFELSFDNLLDKFKARFIDQSFNSIKCIPKF